MKKFIREIHNFLNTSYLWLYFIQMPGPDLFTRRRALLIKHLRRGNRIVLDCGFGNGWFSYLAYRGTAKVIAISTNKNEVKKARLLFNEFKGINENDLFFMELNAYDLEKLNLENQVDEIICFETLEHIREDKKVCRIFYELLKNGGVLHLCCPNADHPKWKNETLDLEEQWRGHTRRGYTLDSYRELLEPIGFKIEYSEKIGGRTLVFLYRITSWISNNLGKYLASIASFIFSPFIVFDNVDSSFYFSIYVKYRKDK